MSNSRNLADLLDANGDVKATSLDNTSLGGLTDANTTATSNLGLGTGAVDSITTGDYNVGVGDSALTAVTSGSWNTAVGTSALLANSTGSSNTAIGKEALESNTTGNNNTALGIWALTANISAYYNTGIGSMALAANTTGFNNTAIGREALAANTTASNNVATGFQALKSNTTGSTNTASGYQALYSNTIGAQNVASGYQALYSNTASYQTAIGYQALYSNTTGSIHTAVGYQALKLNTTGANNTASGFKSLNQNTTGSSNTAVGYYALRLNTTGSSNTALGYGAGDNITTGSSNIMIGYGVDAPSATASNQLNIGNWIYGSGGNIGIGTSSPSTKLHILTNTNTQHRIETTNTGAVPVTQYKNAAGDIHQIGSETSSGNAAFSGASAYSLCLYAASGRDINFGQQGNHRMRLDSSGNLLVGTTTLNTGQNNTIVGTSISNAGRLMINNAGTDNIMGRNTDGVLLSIRKAGQEKGSITVNSSSTSYNTSSDYRLKENVVPMTGSIDRLKALKPSKFNFIADATTTVDGFLAHEAGEVVPECATGTKDAMMDEEYEVTPAVMDGETVVTEAVMGTRSVPDYQGIDQSKLVPLLTSALQEAVAKIEALEARVTALENA